MQYRVIVLTAGTANDSVWLYTTWQKLLAAFETTHVRALNHRLIAPPTLMTRVILHLMHWYIRVPGPGLGNSIAVMESQLPFLHRMLCLAGSFSCGVSPGLVPV